MMRLRTLTMIVATMLAMASGSDADVIALRSSATVAGPTVTLRDVARLSGARAEALGAVELASFATNQTQLTLTLGALRSRLSEAGAHWGWLTCRGPSRLIVTRGTQPSATPQADTDDTEHLAALADTDGAAKANPLPAIHADGGLTLRQRIIRLVRGQIDDHPDNLRITFTDDKDDWLDRTETTERFEIEPLSSDLLGRVPLRVRRYQGTRPVDEHRVTIEVAQRRRVVVALRNLSRRQMVTAADVALKAIWLEASFGQPLTDTQRVVGRRMAGVVREGQVLGLNDLRSPVMVQRGQLVTVRCLSGALVLRTVARAMEDGAMGQTIRIRNERTRQTYTARITGPQEAVIAVGARTEPDNHQLADRGGDS